MERDIYRKLLEWKDSEHRKPLILRGVRQCGKTHILKEFGEREYSRCLCFGFEDDPGIATVFEKDSDTARIVRELSVLSHERIDGDTLIILDEIQFCGSALTSLKYFCEEAPEYHIACTASFLGVELAGMKGRSSFPVGKVDFLTLFPMSFREFLIARNGEHTVQLMESDSEISDTVEAGLDGLYREYLCVGGMPEAVSSWIADGDMSEVERIHGSILMSYGGDLLRYVPDRLLVSVRAVWNSAVSQLSGRRGRFVFGHAAKGARGADLEDAVQWLTSAGILHRVCRISRAELPLGAFAERNSYRLYFSDVGLMRTKAGLTSESMIDPSDSSDPLWEAVTENYVLTELRSSGFKEPFYWTSEGRAEVDFVVNIRDRIVPIEVKTGERFRAKSLGVFFDMYPGCSPAVVSGKGLKKGKITNVPLPMVWMIRDLMDPAKDGKSA